MDCKEKGGDNDMCLRNLFGGMDCSWLLFIIIILMLLDCDNDANTASNGCGCGC